MDNRRSTETPDGVTSVQVVYNHLRRGKRTVCPGLNETWRGRMTGTGTL